MKLTTLLTALAVTASVHLATAQDPKEPKDPNSQRDRGRGNYEEFRQKMAERLKASLKVNDEEWGVIQPLIDKVQTKLRDSMGSRFGGGGPPRSSSGGPTSSSGSSDPSRPERAGSAERDALRTALENESSSPDELKAKLAAVRKVREKAVAELAEAREELRKVLTVRQEATLVSYGLLE
jgi:hypothetical protein